MHRFSTPWLSVSLECSLQFAAAAYDLCIRTYPDSDRVARVACAKDLRYDQQIRSEHPPLGVKDARYSKTRQEAAVSEC